jgi:hypothetical protein
MTVKATVAVKGCCGSKGCWAALAQDERVSQTNDPAFYMRKMFMKSATN